MNASSKSKTIRLVRFIAGTILSALLIWYCLRGLDFEQLIVALQKFSAWSIFWAVAVLWLSLPLRALQWKILLADNKSLLLLLRLTSLGYAYNLIMPMRGGEFAKVYLINRWGNVPLRAGALSSLICRMQDIPPIALALVVVQVQSQAPSWQTKISHALVAYAGGGILVAVASCLLWLLLLDSSNFRKLAPILKSAFEKLGALRKALPEIRYVAFAQFLSFMCWISFVLAAVPLLFDIVPDSWAQSVTTALVVSVWASAASLLPAAPGGLGTVHAASITALSIIRPDIERETAVALAVVLHAVGAIGPALPAVLIESAYLLRRRGRMEAISCAAN